MAQFIFTGILNQIFNLKFIAISDTHCRHRSLRLPPGDVVLHAGDITYRGDKREVDDFLDWFGKLPYRHKIFIAGNHDFYFEKLKPDAIRSMIPEGVHYLKDESIVVDGIKIWGSPYTPLIAHWAFKKNRGKGLAAQWQKIPADTDVLLTHGPAYGMLDMVVNDQHTGDKDLLKKVLEVKPVVHVFGHIHESYGWQRRQGIKFINACVLNEAYELANKPIAFELRSEAIPK